MSCHEHVHTVVVGADLEGLVATHDQTGLAVLLVLEQADVTGSTLLPLLRALLEDKELGAHLEELLLGLLVCLGLDPLGQADHGLEVDVIGLGGLITLSEREKVASQHWVTTKKTRLISVQGHVPVESGIIRNLPPHLP